MSCDLEAEPEVPELLTEGHLGPWWPPAALRTQGRGSLARSEAGGSATP